MEKVKSLQCQSPGSHAAPSLQLSPLDTGKPQILLNKPLGPGQEA